MLSIDFIDETAEISEKETDLISGLLQFAAKEEGIGGESELSVTFVDNDAIREINREYRHKDSATDVISFALEEMGEGEIEIIGGDDMPRMLGDLIISVDRAREQAEEYGHSFDREIGFLALHGFLHLLGYDHMEKEEEVIMFTKQKELLENYGLSRE
ncbi:rRNA maturation RNase YbeY [Bacillus sp. 1P06AnD]|uniref:rRNA maturation RNase YbeY n=1 Tax=Bacillus sp. 1P06AnD TaxID=3132208 RepID=UPI0039A07C7C